MNDASTHILVCRESTVQIEYEPKPQVTSLHPIALALECLHPVALALQCTHRVAFFILSHSKLLLVTQDLFSYILPCHLLHLLKVPCKFSSTQSSTQSTIFHSVTLVSSRHTPLHYSSHWFKAARIFSSAPLALLCTIDPLVLQSFHTLLMFVIAL